jgi:hypothetical protein
VVVPVQFDLRLNVLARRGAVTPRRRTTAAGPAHTRRDIGRHLVGTIDVIVGLALACGTTRNCPRAVAPAAVSTNVAVCQRGQRLDSSAG